MRRASRLVAGALAGTAAAGAVGLALGMRDAAPPASAGTSQPGATAEVTRTDLVTTVTEDGTLGWDDTHELRPRVSGTITRLPDVGAVVEPGGQLYRVDEVPVVLLRGEVPLYRELHAGLSGDDVAEVESNLVALGYTGFTADDDYTAATAQAVRAWQGDLGVTRTGRITPHGVEVSSSPLRVLSRTARTGDVVNPGTAVLEVSGGERTVVMDLTPSHRPYVEVGTTVTVTLPDGTETPGTVTVIDTVAAAASSGEGGGDLGGDGGDSTVIPVTILLTDPAAAADLDGAPVDVDVESERRPGVLAVPVQALLALTGGGYGLEVVTRTGTGTGTHVVPVRTGLFADGLVEVNGTGVAEGDEVVIPWQ